MTSNFLDLWYDVGKMNKGTWNIQIFTKQAQQKELATMELQKSRELIKSQ